MTETLSTIRTMARRRKRVSSEWFHSRGGTPMAADVSPESCRSLARRDSKRISIYHGCKQIRRPVRAVLFNGGILLKSKSHARGFVRNTVLALTKRSAIAFKLEGQANRFGAWRIANFRVRRMSLAVLSQGEPRAGFSRDETTTVAAVIHPSTFHIAAPVG